MHSRCALAALCLALTSCGIPLAIESFDELPVPAGDEGPLLVPQPPDVAVAMLEEQFFGTFAPPVPRLFGTWYLSNSEESVSSTGTPDMVLDVRSFHSFMSPAYASGNGAMDLRVLVRIRFEARDGGTRLIFFTEREKVRAGEEIGAHGWSRVNRYVSVDAAPYALRAVRAWAGETFGVPVAPVEVSEEGAAALIRRLSDPKEKDAEGAGQTIGLLRVVDAKEALLERARATSTHRSPLIEALGDLGCVEAVPILTKRARRDASAIVALANLGPASQSAIPTLIEISRRDIDFGRSLRALSRIAPEDPVVREVLRAAFERPDDRVRIEAARALAVTGEEAELSVAYLIARLSDRSAWDRREAAKALGAIGPGAHLAIPTLRPLLRDSSRDVQVAARAAIYRIGGR